MNAVSAFPRGPSDRFCRLMVLALTFAAMACRHDSKDQGNEILESVEPIRTGHATYFDSLGFPAGGCGVPEKILESPNFLALNVQNTPADYQSYLVRPIAERAKLGAWDNGLNCGRWIRVTLAKNCVGGVNSGLPNTQFCQGGRYEDDEFSGATADFLVADSCQDGNAWCRDDPFHVDLATSSLQRFSKNGQRLADVRGKAWTNRQVSWQYIDAPQYRGDIKIGFVKNAQAAWPAIVITQLQRGIHAVEYLDKNAWVPARTNSDNGQSFILDGAAPYRIRIYDAYDKLINNGRVYTVNFPCTGTCPADYTEATYTVSDEAAAKPQSEVNVETTLRRQAAAQNAEPKKENPAPITSVAVGQLKVEIRTKGNVPQGLCADIIISNPTQKTIADWEIIMDKHGAQFTQQWNIVTVEEGKLTRIKPHSDWNRQLIPGQKLESSGFCYTGSTEPPQVLEVKP